MPRILRSKTAIRDTAEIWHYIAEDSPGAADRWLDGINNRLELLSRFPRMGTDRSDLQRSLRTSPVGKYLILFRPARDGIHLLRVIHGARDLRKLFRRRH